MARSGNRDAHSNEFSRGVAEFTGTFFLTLVAAGADVVETASHGELGHTSHYLAPGFVVAAMIWSISGVSGAHLNPAVTFAFVLRKTFPLSRAVVYWVVQFAGALAAAATLRGFFGDLIRAGASAPGAGIADWAAVAWEAILTLLLLLVILGTAENEAVVGKNAALAVGLTVALCGLFSSPISGASMNPARSLGPQLVAGVTDHCWIYLLGPLLGVFASLGLGWVLFGPPRLSEREAAHGKHP